MGRPLPQLDPPSTNGEALGLPGSAVITSSRPATRTHSGEEALDVFTLAGTRSAMNTRHLADIPSAWNHMAKRFIEAPVYRFPTPDLIAPHADFWRLELMQDGVRHVIESDKPVLDSAPIWPKLRVGSWIQARVYQIDRANNWCVTVTALGA